MAGFGWACLTFDPRQLPQEAICYLRQEQHQRLRKTLKFGGSGSSANRHLIA